MPLFALGAGITAVVIGALVLLGWALDIPILKSLLAGTVAMKPLTAICFVLCGMALALHASRPTGLARLSAGSLGAPVAAALGAVISLASIGELLFHQTLLATHIPNPGRMAPGAALGLLLIALALAGLDAKLPGATRISTVLALLTALMGLIAILRHLYRVEAIYLPFGVLSGDLHTALPLFFLGVGTLLSRPRRGLIVVITSDLFGGWMARRLLPVAVLAPIGAPCAWRVYAPGSMDRNSV